MASQRKRQKLSGVFEDEFVLHEKLGVGQHSIVYRTSRKSDGQVFAVKIIQHRGQHVEKLVQMELWVFQQLKMEQQQQQQPNGKQKNKSQKKNLVQMLKSFRDHKATYVVMEYLRGGELFEQIVERGAYCERDASVAVKQIIQGLVSLHSANVLHCDLKPENLVYQTRDAGSELKIIDFGHSLKDPSARTLLLTNPRTSAAVVGTPGYIAPEVISCRDYSPAGDVFSVGVILYILLCGYAPSFGVEDPRKSVPDFDETTWREISSEAQDLVMKMLDPNPKSRISTLDVLGHVWMMKCSSSPLPVAVSRRLTTFYARRKLRAAALACVWGSKLGMKQQQQPQEESSSSSGNTYNNNITGGRRRRRQDQLRHLFLSREDSANANANPEHIPNSVPGLPFSVVEMHQLSVAFQNQSKSTTASRSRHSNEHVVVTKAQFDQVFASLGLDELPLGRMFALFDTDNSDSVDYKEFLIGLGTLRGFGSCTPTTSTSSSGARHHTTEEATVKFCFDLFDADQSGWISKSELESMFHYLACGDDEEEDSIAYIFEAFDTDGDDRITLSEFQEGIQLYPELTNAFTRPISQELRLRTLLPRIIEEEERREALRRTSLTTISPVVSLSHTTTLGSRPTLHLSRHVQTSDLFSDPKDDIRLA